MPTVESRIDTVTLYQQGARVSRLLSLDCVDGKPPTELEVPRLPLALFDPTVRVRVLSTDNPRADLTSTQVRVGLWVPPRDAPLETVDAAALRKLYQRLRVLESTAHQLEWEMRLFDSIPVPPRPRPEKGKPPPPAPLTSRMALEQLTHEGLQSRLARLRDLHEEMRKLREEAAVLEQRQALASTAREVTAADLFKSVHVQLRHEGGAIARATLSVEYFVPGARWAPSYQCRLTRDCREVELVMRALVGQRSGEDWSGVKLVLSTAAPLSWTELPELSSIRIGRAQPPPPSRSGFRPPPQGAASLFADFDRDRQNLLRALPTPTPFPHPALSSPEDAEDLDLDRFLPANAAPALPPSEPEPEALADLSRDLDDEVEEEAPSRLYEESTRSYASAGPPMMQAPMAPPPPAPALARPAAPMRRVSPKSDLSGESKKMRKESARERSPATLGGKGGPSQEDLEAVVFTHLRLAPPGDTSSRSRLQPLDASGFYLESLRRFPVHASFDVMDAVATAESNARAMAHASLPDGTTDVRELKSHFDFNYSAEATVDVPSDGGFHSVAVGSRTGEASVLYVAVPREDTHVYRQAEVKNPLPAPMLPGPAEVYVGGEYVLSTRLPTVAPRGEFKLGLGVEQAIRCARNTLFQEARSGTKIVATAELRHDLLIDLVNNLDREITCEVRERIPQPAPNAEVVVEEESVTPAWEPYTQVERGNALEGGRRWRLVVPANGARQLSARYVVKLYANNELEGGNRREA